MPRYGLPARESLAVHRLAGECPQCAAPVGEDAYGTGRVADGLFCSLSCLADYWYQDPGSLSRSSPETKTLHTTKQAMIQYCTAICDVQPESNGKQESMTAHSAQAGIGRVSAGQTPLARGALFSDESNFEERYIRDYRRITEIVGALRLLGMRVVLTSGSFDILHEGHSMYLEAARQFGDFLIVGVDSDEKIRSRKGPNRPAVPEIERLRMVTHQRGVGLVTLKGMRDKRWSLIEAVRPDVLVATEDTYSDVEIKELEDHFCGKVEVLARMATVSTSARLRRIQLGLTEPENTLPSEPATGTQSSSKND